MFVMSMLMLGSIHTVQRNHLRHHKHCMDDEDLEGYSARLGAWRALLYGPAFLVRLHVRGFRLGRRRRLLGVLRLRALVPRGGHGDWAVHDLLLRRVDRAPRLRPLARTLRGKVKNRISFEMFFHLEHHLFPKVPTCHLPRLADRLDSAAPELQAHQVF